MKEVIERLEEIVRGNSWRVKENLVAYLKELEKVTYTPKQRTGQQNRSLWLWCTLLAEELNNAGFTIQKVVKEKIDIDWNKDLIMELLWRPAQKAILGKESTKDLAKLEDIDKVFDHLNRHISEKFAVSVQWPNDDDPAPLKTK